MGHAHGLADHRGRLLSALAVTCAVLVLEVVGAALTGSLVLVADAGHVLVDVIGITIAVAAASYARRPAPDHRSYGNARVEVLAALVNGVVLCVVAAIVLVEALQRVGDPPVVEGTPLLVVGALGLVGNLVTLRLLRPANDHLNVRGAYLEALGDLFGSLAVIAAAIVIVATGWDGADVAASLVVVLLIVPRAWSLLRDAGHVLLEGAPRQLALDDVRRHILEVPGVVGVHDLHVWTITSGMPVMSAHVVVDDVSLADGRSGPMLDRLGECMHEHFDVAHSTFQLEPVGHDDHEGADHG